MSESNHSLRLFGKAIPLYQQIIIALVLAVGLGILLGAGDYAPQHKALIENLSIPCDLILKALRALATPLILLAVLHSFMTAEIPRKSGRKLFWLLLTNTLAAILIGLLVANFLQPGKWGQLAHPSAGMDGIKKTLDPWSLLQDMVPEAILKPLVDNNVIQLIILALTFGIALRGLKSVQIERGHTDYLPVQKVISTLFEAVIRILHWIITLIPLAVFGIVARTIALKGFEPFKALGGLVVAVLIALFLQACFYLIRLKFGSWVNPLKFLRDGSNPLITAFSTASSTVTMPITFETLIEKVGLRESSASLGALVGSNFNNDGTALYEAMAALFMSQVIGVNVPLPQQIIVVLTSIFASVGAAGIPEAGLVTMTLVFASVGLPTEYIAILITVDWFLDRCRTAINVMGDMTVSAILDGKQPKHKAEFLIDEAVAPEAPLRLEDYD
jgi:DAACS family dicarboxylate/amino acid:cation (Na+ or H+) symporter